MDGDISILLTDKDPIANKSMSSEEPTVLGGFLPKPNHLREGVGGRVCTCICKRATVRKMDVHIYNGCD